MTEHLPRLPFALDPLIAEAKRRMKHRRLRVLALLGVIAVAIGVAAAVMHSSTRNNVPTSNRASLDTFLRHYWWGHGRLFAIHRSGRGVEKLRTYAPPAPYYATLTFRVIGVTGTQATADARIRVTSVRTPHLFLPARIRVGQFGTLRLRHGVITDSITHSTFCAPTVDRCGL